MSYSNSVKSHVKLALARAITQQFPLLDNEDGDGHVSLHIQCSDLITVSERAGCNMEFQRSLGCIDQFHNA